MKKGFTLLEVIIAITILAFISIFTAQSIQNGIKSKIKIQNTIAKDSLVRDSLKVMASDIRLAFNYRDINIELYNLAQEERKKRAETKKGDKNKNDTDDPNKDPNDDPNKDNNQETTPEDPEQAKKKKTFEKKEEVILTQFMGKGDEIHFTSRSYSRSVENSPYSDMAEVGYFLKRCRNRLIKEQSSECLWRRISPVIDDKIEEGGSETVLLENVTSLKFRYLGPGSEEEWRHDWMSGEGGDATTKDKFPYAVEITIEVQNKNIDKDKPLAMTVVAPVAFANNKEETQGDGSGETQPSDSQTQ